MTDHKASVFPLVASAVLLMAPIATAPQSTPGVRLRSITADPVTGVARAVVVEEGALVHTALMFPEDQQGLLQGGADVGAQAARVLANIELALQEARTTLDHLVRLHIYVADSSVTVRIDRWLADRFGGRETQPAVTLVETEMPRAGALVAMDAIAATAWTATAWTAAPGAARRLRHLVKATYYVSHPAADGRINAIRPTIAYTSAFDA